MIRRALLCAVVSVASASCATPALPTHEARQPPTIQLVPCRVPESSDNVLCGKYAVFENRAARAGRRITLNIVVLPAIGPKRVADPVFVLTGGPGLGAASRVTGDTVNSMERLRQRRDIVFVDQRGTGDSHRLFCRFHDGAAMQNSFNDLFPLDKVRACREALERLADVRLYTTPIAMDDLDEVRAALGYETINLYGVSCGAQAALQYLRQHPTRVRSAALAGVATPAAKQPLNFARAAQHAMLMLIDDCAAGMACRRAFPNLNAEFEAVLATFERGPVTFELRNPTSKITERVIMSRGVFVERRRLMLYDLDTASRVPLVIHHAAQSDWVPFATTSPSGAASGVSGMYLTVTCSKTVTHITEEDIVRESRDTFVGEYRTRRHIDACQEWPRGDAATPVHLASSAARSLANSRQIVIRNAAHAYWYDCMQNLVAEFVSKGSPRDVDVTCAQNLRRPPFVTELPPPLHSSQ